MPAAVPKPSFSSDAIAPAKRDVPDTRCWFASSFTAVVSDRPGSSTITLDSTTGAVAIGSTNSLTSAASTAATTPAIASKPGFSCGRARSAKPSRPTTAPIAAAAPASFQPDFSNSATVPAATPCASAYRSSPRFRRRSGASRRSWR